jgi:transcriptional regulatory protein GAL4
LPNATILPDEIALPTVYSSLILQSEFHLTTNPLYHRLISNPPPAVHELLILQKPIDAWQESIPSYFQLNNPDLHQNDYFILDGNRLSWRMWNLRIILFRPIVLRWASKHWTANQNGAVDIENLEEEKCRLLCLQSARETIASISEHMAGNVPSRLASWYILLAPYIPHLIYYCTLYSIEITDA